MFRIQSEGDILIGEYDDGARNSRLVFSSRKREQTGDCVDC